MILEREGQVCCTSPQPTASQHPEPGAEAQARGAAASTRGGHGCPAGSYGQGPAGPSACQLAPSMTTPALLCHRVPQRRGQLKAPDTPGKELLQQVERLYGLVRTEAPEDAPGVQELCERWLQGAGSERAGRLLHTSLTRWRRLALRLSIRW